MTSTSESRKPNQQRSRYTFDQFTAIRRYQGTLAFAPDGDEIAYSVNTSGQYNLWRQPSEGGYPHQVTLSGEEAVREGSWSPDGATLLYTADHHADEFTKVFMIPTRGGLSEQIPSEADVQHFIAGAETWSPDGSSIAYAANDREPTDQDVIIRNVSTGASSRPLAGGGMFFPMGWSPDGKQLLAVKMHSNTNMDIHLVDVVSDTSRLLTGHQGEIKYLPVGWADGSGFYMSPMKGENSPGLPTTISPKIHGSGKRRLSGISRMRLFPLIDAGSSGRSMKMAIHSSWFGI